MKKRFRAFLNQNLAKLRKYARGFTTWHTGVQPFTGLVKFKSRPRKILRRAAFQFRKKVNFRVFHTGLQPSINLVQFKSRQRKIKKQASFVLRKLAKFRQWHTGSTAATPNPINVIRFKAHKRYKSKTRKARLNLFGARPTGLQPSIQSVQFKTRKRKIKAVKRYRGYRLTGIRFSGATIVSTRNWVSSPVSSYTKRGGD